MSAPIPRRVRFGDFELDLTTGELRPTDTADGNNVLLREQVFQVLRMLLEHEGKIGKMPTPIYPSTGKPKPSTPSSEKTEFAD
jgi:DNA-binding response OmpR family regulator